MKLTWRTQGDFKRKALRNTYIIHCVGGRRERGRRTRDTELLEKKYGHSSCVVLAGKTRDRVHGKTKIDNSRTGYVEFMIWLSRTKEDMGRKIDG